MPKKIEADISPQFRGRVLKALKYAKKTLDQKSYKLWVSYSSKPDFHLWNPPPEYSEITNHSTMIGGLIVGIENEIRNEKKRLYQAKRREKNKKDQDNI